MTKFWIFSVKGSRIKARKITGTEIYKQRMADKYWGIRKNARNRTKLERGDLVIFYLTGKGGQMFLGTCTLDSAYHVLTRQERRRLIYGMFFRSAQGVRLTEIDRWDKPVSIRPLIKNLGFIKKPQEWECYLHGAIRRIPEQDYDTIVSFYESDEIKKQSEEAPSLTEKSSFTTAKRRGRDYAFRKEVKENYKNRCAVCRKRRITSLGDPEVESCHIYPKKENGKDDPRNGIALCKLHHWAFENVWFSINDHCSIVVEDRTRSHSDYQEIARFENRKIMLPSNYKPHPLYLQAHRELHHFE